MALGIMASSLLATLGVVRKCARVSYHNQQLSGSVHLAERLLGELRVNPPTALEEREGEEENYTWEMTIAETPVEGLAAVLVTVKWREQNREQDYELVTLVPIVVE